MIAATSFGRALAPVEMVVAQLARSRRGARAPGGGWTSCSKNRPAAAATALPAPAGTLEAEGVVLRAPGAERPSSRGVSFAVQPGEALGIIGPGAGKSTLARLLVGIWQPRAGVRAPRRRRRLHLAARSSAPHIGYLPQDVELFAGTVAENIARLGEPDSGARSCAPRSAPACTS